MGFVDDISDYRSLAIVGLEKNTGKTECLNYIHRRITDSADRFALTSIGIDGENRDQVCQTPKPEIIVPEGMIFVTSEKHYRERRLVAEIMEIDDHRTALGRLVIARAKTSGKVLLSGPADTAGLKSLIRHMKDFGVRTTLVDGALSRLSLASPIVTEAMVLATGAAVSGNIRELVRRTRYVCDLIDLEEVDEVLQERLDAIQQGVWAVGPEGECIDLKLPSVFMLEKIVRTVKATGAIVSGPIPLPTHKRIFTVNRSTFVNKKSREQFELSSYKRLIDIYSSTAKTVDALMKLELPSGVEVEIKV